MCLCAYVSMCLSHSSPGSTHRTNQSPPTIQDGNNNDEQGRGVENKKPFVFRLVGRQFFVGYPGYCNQRNGDQHHKTMLHGPVSGGAILHGGPRKLNDRADKIQEKPGQELEMGKNQQPKRKFVVHFRKRLFVQPAQQGLDRNNDQEQQDNITKGRVGMEQCVIHRLTLSHKTTSCVRIYHGGNELDYGLNFYIGSLFL